MYIVVPRCANRISRRVDVTTTFERRGEKIQSIDIRECFAYRKQQKIVIQGDVMQILPSMQKEKSLFNPLITQI